MLRKLFKPAKVVHWTIPWPRPGLEAWQLLQTSMHQGGLEKEVVDEIIFRTVKPRNRLMLELMARGGHPQGSELHV